MVVVVGVVFSSPMEMLDEESSPTRVVPWAANVLKYSGLLSRPMIAMASTAEGIVIVEVEKDVCSCGQVIDEL